MFQNRSAVAKHILTRFHRTLIARSLHWSQAQQDRATYGRHRVAWIIEIDILSLVCWFLGGECTIPQEKIVPAADIEGGYRHVLVKLAMSDTLPVIIVGGMVQPIEIEGSELAQQRLIDEWEMLLLLSSPCFFFSLSAFRRRSAA